MSHQSNSSEKVQAIGVKACGLCGGTHYGSLGCPYRCARCTVNTEPCSEAECPRNASWAAADAVRTDPKPHDCVKRINKMLADRKSNTVIATAINFSEPAREMIQIATAKDDPNVRGKPVSFFASYCPFCGVKLEEDAIQRATT